MASAACSAVRLPKNTYPLWDALPAELVDKGKLSALQLEGIVSACRAHQSILASGERAGFFIGEKKPTGDMRLGRRKEGMEGARPESVTGERV